MSDTNLVPLIRKNLLTVAQAAVGTQMFQHIYVFDKTKGTEVDTMENGRRSCASFLSTVLAMHSLIDRPHSTVATTIRTMQEAGWHEIQDPHPGAVVRWPADKDGHQHLGFVINEDTCVSNSADDRTPKKHGMILSDGRAPAIFYWHPKLDNPNLQ